jgi:hypothetical protein
MGYCDIMNVCRIVDADGPIASLGNYIFNGVLFDAAENLAKEYWWVEYLDLPSLFTVMQWEIFILGLSCQLFLLIKVRHNLID